MCQQYTKNQLKVALQTKTKLSETEIEDVLKTLDGMDNRENSTLITFVDPKCIFGGIDENRKEWHA